ncbi:MAG: hypothetical protein NZ761_04190, partial [Dehalococcoidia bacterium]|nr:hypothetical protein [Dehalococcoidia bacterium]
MARHIVNIVVIWVILTVLGALVLTLNFFPATGAEFAKDFNGIFRLLAFMGLPVVTFVFAWVGYSFFAFRARSGEDEGPAFWGRNWVPIVWLAVTAALAITVMIYPGLTGLAKL